MNKYKVLVTGAAGFIGSWACRRLCDKGYYAIGLDDLSTGRVERLDGIDMDFHESSILDVPTLNSIVDTCKAVIHCAALVSVPESFTKASLYRNVNFWGSLNVLEASRHTKVERVVFLSSCAVYGAPHPLPVREDTRVGPKSPYAEQKLEVEAVLRQMPGLNPLILRLQNCYGPAQSKDSPYSGVVARFCAAEAADVAGVIKGDGEQSRDFVYVGDVVDAIMLGLKNPEISGVYNIGSGKPTSIKTLYSMISKRDPVHLERSQGDIDHMWADISKAKKELGWSPKTSLKKGLKATAKYYGDKI